ncbi:MAG TPA: carboxypeptidase regulatory-like domain-containing protein [Terracidiphilus sp.]|nr:carboxypeptidase regulatory-like domain-containing protein [Terracidiphilus sp.]
MLSFRFKKAIIAISLLTALLIGGNFAAWSQATSGDIVGTVLDRSGAAIPAASVTATNVATGVASTVQASKVGDFHIPNLLPGNYNVSASAAGFATFTLKNFTVTLNSTGTARLVLPVATTSTVVEVSAEAGVTIDTTTTQLQTSFESEELKNLPTSSSANGVLNLALLVPGVASGGGMGVGTGPSVGGLRPEDNNYTIEGIDNNNKGVTGPLVYVPNDATGEFTAIVNQFSPEFGHSAGGQFNTTVRGGTNKLHGIAYEYFQNRNLNANNAIQGGKTDIPRYDNNRFGGQAGGAIIKDKLFYFGSYERQSIGQSGSYYLCTPTAAGMTAIKGMSGFNANNLGVFTKYVPVSSSQVTDANDHACFNQDSGSQFLTLYTDTNFNSSGPSYAGNIAAAGTGAYGSAGAQNIPLGNYLIAAPNFSNFDVLTTSTDWTISPRDSFRGRYIYNRWMGIDTAASIPAFFEPLPEKFHIIALSEFHNFTPNLINEARIGFNRFFQDYPAGNFAFQGLDSFPNLVFSDTGNINIGPDSNAPQSTIQNLYQLTDNLSYVKGKHSLKFGFDGRKFIAPQSFTQRVRGDYEYYYLTEYLHDLGPTNFGERSTGNFFYYGDQTSFYGYANDTWRISEKLSLNFGLRYEFTAVPVGERAQKLNIAASVPGLVTFDSPQPQKTNFFPRVGINYALNPNTSIRMGFGTAGDVLDDNLGLLSFPPQYSSTNDVSTNLGANPGPADCTGTAAKLGAYSAGCPGYLTNGGLPHGTGTLNTYSTLADQRAATSAWLPVNQILPYAENWTLGVQHVFRNVYTAEVRYVGTRGIHLPTQDQINVQPKVTTANQIPTLLSAPATATLGTMTNNLLAITNLSNIVKAWGDAGFTGKVTSYRPLSESNYNGMEASLNRHFTNGLLLNLSWTWSKAMDDATAATFSTTLTPRRPQNSQNVAADYSRSALSRTHRITLVAVYDLPFFKTSGWLLKNTIGNWEIAPIYTYESPEYFTVLSGANSNLNGEGGGIDRTIFNGNGVKHTGTGVTAYANPNLAINCPTGTTATDPNGTIICSANTVAYVAKNPNAEYITAAAGTLPTAQRNTEPINPINNFDATAIKRFNFGESRSVEFQAQAYNVLNHAQYVPGSINNVSNPGYSTLSTAYQTASNSAFRQAGQFFKANARTMQLTLKFNF